MRANTDNVTELLRRGGQGDRAAMDEAMALVYKTLRRIAGAHMRNQPAGHTLQPTALVHEVYLRLAGRTQLDFQDRTQFLHLASKAMRRMLVDHARAKGTRKRGGGQVMMEFDDSLKYGDQKGADLIRLTDALDELAKSEERAAKVLELRIFGGLSIDETAEALGIATATVKRDAAYAQAWLRRKLLA